MLARNTTADRAKALGYIEQAVAVLEDHTTDDRGNSNVRAREYSYVFPEVSRPSPGLSYGRTAMVTRHCV